MGFSAWHADFAHWSVAGCAVSGDVWLVAAGGFDVSGALALLAQPATARGLLHRGKRSFGMLKRMCRSCRVRAVLPPRSAFAGFRFPREVIVLAVRWYLRYGLSYRDVQELLAERGVTVDHVTVYRWVQTSTAEFIDAARPAGPLPRGRPAWAGHRRPGRRTPRCPCCAGVLHPCAQARPGANQDHDGPRPGVPARDRGCRARSATRARALSEQPRRDRSRPAQSAATTDARGQDHPVTTRPRVRTRLHAEPTPRALRAHRRCRCSRPRPHRIHRTRPPLVDRAATATR